MQKRRRKQKVGVPPGSLVFVGEKTASSPKIVLFHYSLESCFEKKVDQIETCLPFLEKPGHTWIHVCGLNKPDMISALGRHLNWHPLLLEDIMFTGQRPKIDDYKDYIYIVTRMLILNLQTREIEDEQVSLVFGKNYLVSFTETGNHTFDPVYKELNREGSLIRKQGPDYLCYSIVDSIVDHYFLVIEEMDDRLESMENKLMGKASLQLLQSILKKKRQTSLLRKHVWPMREVIRSFQKNESPLIAENTKIFINDVYDHTIQAVESIEGLRDIANDMIEIHLSSMNQHLNQTMTFLTVIATIFVPLTFIASIYGMNFKYMPELDWVWGYPVTLLVMFATAIAMLYYFYKKRWL